MCDIYLVVESPFDLNHEAGLVIRRIREYVVAQKCQECDNLSKEQPRFAAYANGLAIMICRSSKATRTNSYHH